VPLRQGHPPPRSAPPLVIRDSEQFREIINKQSDRLIVVDFFASWCAPCQALVPVFRKLAPPLCS